MERDEAVSDQAPQAIPECFTLCGNGPATDALIEKVGDQSKQDWVDLGIQIHLNVSQPGLANAMQRHGQRWIVGFVICLEQGASQVLPFRRIGFGFAQRLAQGKIIDPSRRVAVLIFAQRKIAARSK